MQPKPRLLTKKREVTTVIYFNGIIFDKKHVNLGITMYRNWCYTWTYLAIILSLRVKDPAFLNAYIKIK